MNVVLRRMRQEDAEAISCQLQNPLVRQYLRDRLPDPYTVEDARRYIRLCADSFPEECVIEADGQLAGIIDITRQSDVYRINAEIGYWLGYEYWGKGIATEAIRQMTNAAFRLEGIERVFGAVFSTNAASARALEKNAYRKEAHHKNAAIKQGLIQDYDVFAITKEEWMQRRSAGEKQNEKH